MEQLRIFNIDATSAELHDALTSSQTKEHLREGVRVIAADLAKRAFDKPLSIYVCSTNRDRDLRNYFAFVVAKEILDRLPNTLVVDCDFSSVGLSGLVPNQDKVGFLDLLLYGSSLSVITQEAKSGVNVIGAGSVAVLKVRSSSFEIDEFVDAARYLSLHAGCAIFCGPVLDDDGVHPIVTNVDLPIVVHSTAADSADSLGQLEEEIVAERDSMVWSVRFADPASPVDVVEPSREGVDVVELPYESQVDGVLDDETPARDRRRETVVDAVTEPEGSGPTEAIEVPFEEEGPDATIADKPGSSIFPRIITSVLAVFLVGFLIWWLYLTKSFRSDVGEPPGAAQRAEGQRVADGGSGGDVSVPPELSTVRARDSLALATGPKRGSVERRVATAKVGVAEEDTAVPGKAGAASDRPPLPEDLKNYAGKYLVHVSSFRRIERARRDADYLDGRGYDTVVALVDVGNKGLWYRVYVGPLGTRREATAMKIRLDENPRVRSTRITRVPDEAQ
jgi:cell division septation protein DedD